MVDPLSVVMSTILPVVNLIGSAALTARQNKDKCMELARRASNLGDGLPAYAKAAGNTMATLHGLERLRDALNEAFTVINSCQESCILSCIFSSGTATDLDNVNSRINNCLSDLNFFSLAYGSVPAQTYGSYYQAQGAASSACVGFPTPQHPAVNVQCIPAPAPYPAQTYDYGSYYQAQGAASSACVGFPTPQHPAVNVQSIPAPAPYPAAPPPSGYNLSSFYTLPTLNKIFDRVFR